MSKVEKKMSKAGKIRVYILFRNKSMEGKSRSSRANI